MSTNNIKLSWQDVFAYVEELHYAHVWNHINPTEWDIVTIARGGLIPATLFAHMSNIKNIYVYNPDKTCTKSLPDEDRRLIFIDDILDTGKTLDIIRDKFFNYDIKYFFLVAKNRLDNNHDLKGVEYAKLVPCEWVEFPWEVY